MIYSKKIHYAIRFSIKTHEVYQKQKRKGKDIPYITHPLTVGLILARAGASDDVISAGILHDTIEDSPAEKKVTESMLAERFGETVASLVADVSETSKSVSWELRKQEALEHIKTFSHDALLVKSADVLSNTTETIDDYRSGGKEIFQHFTALPEKTVENYIHVIEHVLERWPANPLAEDLTATAQELRGILQEL